MDRLLQSLTTTHVVCSLLFRFALVRIFFTAWAIVVCSHQLRQFECVWRLLYMTSSLMASLDVMFFSFHIALNPCVWSTMITPSGWIISILVNFNDMVNSSTQLTLRKFRTRNHLTPVSSLMFLMDIFSRFMLRYRNKDGNIL